MRGTVRAAALGLWVSLFTAGCSCLNWGEEGQPCLSGRCLLGFACVDDKCVAAADACGGCAAGERCIEATKTCIPDNCETKACPPGMSCTEQNGKPACVELIEPELGHPCASDAQCQKHGADRLCFRSSVQLASGALRPGVCIERCRGAGCSTAGAECHEYSLAMQGETVRFCLSPRRLFPCATDTVCAQDGMVCTVFDHRLLGPATMCDLPLTEGADAGAPCSVNPSTSGAPLCQNGLCVPRNPLDGQAQTCGEPCDTGTCGAGRQCQLVEYSLLGAFRHVPMCVTSLTRCRACTSTASCGFDAPRCTPLRSALYCLSSCTPDAGLPCPQGLLCTALDAGHRCVPGGGLCP